MTLGLSIGFFVAQALHDDIATVARNIPALLSGGSRHYPVRSRPIYGPDSIVSGVRYVAVGGHVPFARAKTWLPDGRMFRFIIEAANRPAALIVPNGGEQPIMDRRMTLQESAFRLGGVELQVGQALHFDRTEATEALTALPWPGISESNAAPPGYVAIEVDGFDRDQVGPALDKARAMIEHDRAFWDRAL